MTTQRLLTLALALLCWLASAPAWAAFGETWTDSGSTTVWSAATAVNMTISAASGDTICVITSVDATSRTMAITDNKGGGSNTYTRLSTLEDTGTGQEAWVDCTVTTGTVTQITGTISSTISTSAYLTAVVVTGARDTLGTANVTAVDAGSQLNHSPGTLATTDATGLFILIHRHTGSSGFTLDGAYTSRYTDTGYVIGSAVITTTSTPTSTTAGNRTAINLLAEVRPAAAGATVNFFPRRLQVNP